ncbi:MAG: ABC transporter ATP-binding protein [Clostridiales bacterium]|nr:ABC transporter ATP-binding protein [Clostridiales bacterium]
MIKRFISYYKEHKFLFTLDLIAAFFLAGIQLVYPAATTKIVDDYIPTGQIDKLLIMVAILVGLYLVMAGLNYFMHYWGHVVGIRIEASMRSDFFRHLQKMQFKFFDENRTGKLMSRIVNDLNLITELAHHGPEDLFISLVMFFGSFVVLMTKQWQLALIIYFGVIPIMVWFSVSQRSNMSKGFKAVREKTADINAQIENALSGIRVSKSFTNEEYEIKRFDEGNMLFLGAKNMAYKAMAFFITGMGFFMSMLNLIVLALGGIFATRGIITGGELIGFLLYINLVMQPIRRLTNFTQQFEQGMSGFARFDEIMNIEAEIQGGEIELKNAQGKIEFRNVSFSYNDDEQVLKDIDLSISPGTNIALVGPSGGGKSTICHLIPRFYDIQQGEIFVDGVNIKDYTLESLRQNIGLVQQDVFLFTGTIADNIRYGSPNTTDEEMIEAAIKASIHEYVSSLPDKYETWVGEKGIRLSGGQKQRISIARVFLKNPPILILDEATSSLDNETEVVIQKSLEELTQGRTSLVIAHRLSTIRNADIIFVLSGDGIVERGSHTQLYSKEDGIYKRLYDAQFFAEQNKPHLFD